MKCCLRPCPVESCAWPVHRLVLAHVNLYRGMLFRERNASDRHRDTQLGVIDVLNAFEGQSHCMVVMHATQTPVNVLNNNYGGIYLGISFTLQLLSFQ
jgi:hypothetical protein